MRSQFLSWQSHQLKILLVFIMGFFSHTAYSADPIVCAPTGYRPEIHINQNITVSPAGYSRGTGYAAPTPVAQPGPVTCASYTPTAFSVMTFSPSFAVSPSVNASVDIGNNFKALVTINTSTGLRGTDGGYTYLDGNTPYITQNYYPEVYIYSPSQKGSVADFYVNDTLIGYIETTGKKIDDSYISTDTSGLTAVYYSGMIHVPPYCEFSLNNPTVIMPTVFASDFVAAGAGGKVGPMSSLLQEDITCTGGSTAGDDLVHISVSSGNASPIDSPDVIGTNGGDTDIGIQVFDGDGNQLKVNGPVAATVNTHPVIIGTSYYGNFKYGLQFQLVSMTGNAPKNVSTYFSAINVNLSMD